MNKKESARTNIVMIKILLIEDNLEMRENTAEILELANYEVITAEDGRIGVDLATNASPDLIVCDIMMPELDGYGVLFLLSQNPKTAGIPFIFLTAKAEKSDLRKGMEQGADDYVTKPFEDLELLNAIESRIKRSEIFKKDYKEGFEGLSSFIDEARGLEELNKLSEDRKLRAYGIKETIYHEDDYPNGMFYLNKGKVKTYRMNEDGKEYVTGLFKPGDFFGYMALIEDCNYTETAEVMEDAELFKIPKQDFLLLIQKNRDVAHKFVKILSANVIQKEEELIKLAYNSIRKRVADALLLLRKRYMEENADQEEFTIAVSRDNLASIVGTATESVIRTLSEFKEDKLIAIQGRQISILDADKLANLPY